MNMTIPRTQSEHNYPASMRSPLWYRAKLLEICSSSSGSSFQNLSASEGAAVPKLTRRDVLGDPAQLGGNGVLKEGRRDVDALRVVKERRDEVVLAVGHLAGGEVADEAAEALLWLDLGEDGQLEVKVVLLFNGALPVAPASSAAPAGGEGGEQGGRAEDGHAAGEHGGRLEAACRVDDI